MVKLYQNRLPGDTLRVNAIERMLSLQLESSKKIQLIRKIL